MKRGIIAERNVQRRANIRVIIIVIVIGVVVVIIVLLIRGKP